MAQLDVVIRGGTVVDGWPGGPNQRAYPGWRSDRDRRAGLHRYDMSDSCVPT